VNLLEELGIECLVGHPAEIRAAEPRNQKHDRRDADLLLTLLMEGRFPAIWLPTKEQLDLRALLRHRHQWVRLRVKIQNALQAIALANGFTRFLSVDASRPTGDRLFAVVTACRLSASPFSSLKQRAFCV
jgi:transposase